MIKHPRPYWYRLRLFGITIDIRWYPTSAYTRYRELAQLIHWEQDPERKNELIAERLELGNRYQF